MPLAAIPEIRVETSGNDATYWLPMRQLGFLRWFGLAPVGFSGLMLRQIAPICLHAAKRLRGNQHFAIDYLTASVLLGMAGFACLPALFGLWRAFGRRRVVWRGARLTVWQTVGPFGWPQRMPQSALRKLTVRGGAMNTAPGAVPAPMAGMSLLIAEFENGRPRVLASIYPREWLEALAVDLCGRVAQSQRPPPQVDLDGVGIATSKGG